MAEKLSELYKEIPKWHWKEGKEFREALLGWYLGIPRVVIGFAVVLLIGSLGLLIKGEAKIPWYETIFDNLESIALGSAGVIFLLEIKDRQKQDHYEAWQVINSAQGRTGNGGRIQALEDLNRDGVNLEGVAVPRSDLSYVKLCDAKLACANFRKAKLYNAHFNRTILDGADLQKVNLVSAQLRGARLQGANLREADLRHADFRAANLEVADLRGALLLGAQLQEAQLLGADLRGASLGNVNFRGANLYEAKLHGAILVNANLLEADLERAEGVTQQQLCSTKLCRTKLPDGITLDPNLHCKALGIDPETGKRIK